MEFGEKLQQLRAARGLSQEELALRLGVSRQAVSKWEKSISWPSTANLVYLAGMFGLPVEELANPRPAAPAPANEGAGRLVLRLENLVKRYGEQAAAVNGVSLEIEEGSFVAIMGASGCGKSTLLNLIAAMDTATSGSVMLNSRNLASLTEAELAGFRRDDLGVVFQEYNLLDTLTLRENMALALTIQKVKRQAIDGMIEPMARRLGIEQVLDRFPYQVSGGQRQRCACARAMLTSPRLLLADEPTGALDSASAQALMEALSELNQAFGVTVLLATHDAFTAGHCQRVLFMQDGCITGEVHRRAQPREAFVQQILAQVSRMGGAYVP